MSALVYAALVLAGAGLVVIAYLVWVWRRAGDDSKRLVKAIWRLSPRDKLRLAKSLARDRRIPLLVRLLPPALVIYLALPLDLIPDFVPVLGQLDDILVAGIGVALLLRFVPRGVIEEKLLEVGGAGGSTEP